MKKNISLSFLLLISLLLFAASCNTTEPSGNQTLALALKDVSCTEAWLQLTTTNLQLPATINLYKNNSLSNIFNLNSQDSLLYIDSLLPNQNYKFKAVLNTTNNPQPTTNEVLVQTMDTTSHNFTWQTFTFGEHSSNTLYDVVIINENNIWAVGEIYMNDSLGNPDPSLYNLIKWDGISWKPERVYFKDSQGQSFLAPMKSIFAFNENDIWIGSDIIFQWNGSTYKSIVLSNAIFDGWINKIWGSSSNDLYIVGNSGNIAHFNSNSWIKIESVISTDLQDTWGVSNRNGDFIKYIAARNLMLTLDSDNKIKSINVAQNMILLSIWGKTPYLLYTAGNGAVFYKNYVWNSLNNSNVNHMYRVRGRDFNDVYGISSPGNIINHFNGHNWSSIETESENKYWALNVKNNTTAAVGYQLNKAIITILKR